MRSIRYRRTGKIGVRRVSARHRFGGAAPLLFLWVDD